MKWTRRHTLWSIASLVGITAVVGGFFFVFASPSLAACVSDNAYQAKSVWVELGTNSGPVASPERSEPSHVLLWHDEPILIDVGDGAAEQLAKAHVGLGAIHTIFLSHLHFDHTGGLFGVLGMRSQQSIGQSCGPVTIYGPPGTKALVDGLLKAMEPGLVLMPTSATNYRVVELNDGSKLKIGGVSVTAASNSHYDLWKGTGPHPVSLSYRFDLPDRSIVYSGDTGPSANLEKLARGADLLVSEIIDADVAIDVLRKKFPGIPSPLFSLVKGHLTEEHLVPEQAALLAQRAGVHRLVFTHFGGAFGGKPQIRRLTGVIAQHYKGPVQFASDLDRF